MSLRGFGLVLLPWLAWGCGAAGSSSPDASVDGTAADVRRGEDARDARAGRDASTPPDASSPRDSATDRSTAPDVTHEAAAMDAPSSACTNTQTDPDNCGRCGWRCAIGATCAQGVCSPACTPNDCPAGTGCGPGGVCIPTTCGAAPFQYCFVSATDTGMCCGGTCVDVSTDLDNCGGCESPCEFSGEVCARGQCTSPPADCATAPPGAACLDDGGIGMCCGTCRSLDSFFSDTQNCGACGNICPSGGVCSDQSSSCGQDCMTIPCGPGTACVGTECLTTSCDASSARKPCALPSSGTGLCCGSVCADATRDDSNCGACGHACGAGSFCDDSLCIPTPTCAVGNSGVDCPLPGAGVGTCCSVACIQGFDSDPSNCGACGAMCPMGDTCTSGSCAGGSVTCRSGTVLSDDGAGCAPATCASGATGVACAFNGTVLGVCCAGVCVDVESDPSNCSACGTVCPSGACVGRCVPPASTTVSPSCTSPGVYFVDPLLGSSCATPSCPTTLPATYCAVGSQIGVCCAISEAFDAPSTCVDLATDPKNCGGCLIVCAGAQTCADGVCSGASPTCGAGRSGELCDLANGPSWLCCGGGCTNTDTDGKNCGSCGVPCAGTLTCVGGQCQ